MIVVSDIFTEVDQLVTQGAFDEAQKLLDQHPGDADLEVLRIKLGLHDGSLAPGLAMQRLILLMRANPTQRGAKEVYQDASHRAYSERQSSVSHSHPPPSAETGKKGDP